MNELIGAPNPTRDVAALRATLERVGRVLERPDDVLFAPALDVSSWNAAEHVFHLVLALDLSLRNATSLVRERGRLIRDPEDRQPDALALLRRGRIPRGTAEAPRFARPPASFELSLVRELFGEARGVAQALDPDALANAPRAIPHQEVGDLTATEWVRFARLHSTHHLVIVREILAG